MLVLHVNSDTLIRWDAMKDAETDQYVNTATVTFSVKDGSGVAVVGASNVPMPHVADHDGRYEGILSHEVTLTPGATYFVDSGADLTRTNAYFVRPIISGLERSSSASFTLPANAPVRQYLRVPLQVPPSGVTPAGELWRERRRVPRRADRGADLRHTGIGRHRSRPGARC